MKIDVIKFDDGLLTLDLDDEAATLLIEIAINKILKDAIKEKEDAKDDDDCDNYSSVCPKCGGNLVCDGVHQDDTYPRSGGRIFPSDD